MKTAHKPNTEFHQKMCLKDKKLWFKNCTSNILFLQPKQGTGLGYSPNFSSKNSVT